MFIKLDDKSIVNIAHIVDAAFRPANPDNIDIDDIDGVERTMPLLAKLTITTTAIKPASDYSGNYVSCSQSQTLIINGDDAERVWQLLCEKSMIVG